ncbi:MAG: hypothetical protein ACFFG0_26405, partial [Candidatus Thorarchaeota archaeon]
KLREKLGNKLDLAAIHYVIGRIYLNQLLVQDKIKEALDHTRKGLKLQEEMDYKGEIAAV